MQHYRSDRFKQTEGGYKALCLYLKRDHGIVLNHKKSYRLCKKHGLLLKRPLKKKSKFNKPSSNHKVISPNQVWEFDIKYGYLHGQKRFFFLLAFIDVFTREIKGWYLGRSCKAADVLRTFKLACENHRCPGLVIRSDNGPQMRSNEFQRGLEELPAQHEFIPIRSPNKNAHIESFFSIYDKFIQQEFFWDYRDAYHFTLEFMRYYNQERIHGSLKMSPKDFGEKKNLHMRQEFMQAI